VSALPPKADSLWSGLNGLTQHGAKFSVVLDMPLSTHGLAAAFARFGMEQNPFPPSRRLSAASRVVLLESSLYVSRPADIGPTIIFASASQHINETEHLVFWEWFNQHWAIARRPLPISGFLHC
jgi:hypothetical protein